MTDESARLNDAPELVAGLLRDVVRQLSEGNIRMGGIERGLAKVEFAVARLNEQVTIANGRTGKIEDRLARVDIDEIPFLKSQIATRMEETEGNIQAIQETLLIEDAKAKARREMRAEDRARLRYFWDVIDHPITKFVLGGIFLGLTVVLGRFIPWLG